MRKQNIAVTVDAVIFYRKADVLNVLLIKRKNEPFRDQWALPGGFLEENETMEEGAIRELQEEAGLKLEKLQQVGAFGTPGRDPRGRTISIAFLGLIDATPKVKASDDAIAVKWFNVKGLPDMAFDHRAIISEANSLL